MVTERGRSRPHARRGEVWSVNLPNLPHDPHQPRYALVISDDVRNEMRDDVIVVPIYSRGRGITRIPIPADEGGLDHDSVLFCEQVSCIYEDFLIEGPFATVGAGLLRLTVGAVALAITPIEEHSAQPPNSHGADAG